MEKRTNEEAERVRQAALEILRKRNEDELWMRTLITSLQLDLEALDKKLNAVIDENVHLRKGSFGLNALVNARGLMLAWKRIAERGGTETNWPNWIKTIDNHLEEIDKVLYKNDQP